MRCCTDAQLGLAELCEAVEGNFLEIPFPEGTFDGAYAIEATCHAAKVTAAAYQFLICLGSKASFSGGPTAFAAPACACKLDCTERDTHYAKDLEGCWCGTGHKE